MSTTSRAQESAATEAGAAPTATSPTDTSSTTASATSAHSVTSPAPVAESAGSAGSATGPGVVPGPRRGLYDVVAVMFVSFLLISNIAATKLIGLDLGPFHLIFDGGAILFPLTYIFGDVLSEVYGFKSARRVIVLGFIVQLIASFAFWLAVSAPAAADYTDQDAFAAVLGVVPRFVAASMGGYLVGQLLNSYVLVKIKQRWGEKQLWARLIGSTIVGEAADTAVFCAIAWGGLVVAGEMPLATIINLGVVGFLYKVGVEVLFLPATYTVVGVVKRREPEYAPAS